MLIRCGEARLQISQTTVSFSLPHKNQDEIPLPANLRDRRVLYTQRGLVMKKLLAEARSIPNEN